MTDMIEKIARAMAEVEDHYQQTADAEDVWRTYIPHAKAALTALEQPSDEMVEAGAKGISDAAWGLDRYNQEPEEHKETYREYSFAVLRMAIKAARGDQ